MVNYFQKNASLTLKNPVRCLVIFFSETLRGCGGGWEWGGLGEINSLCKIISVWILGFRHFILFWKANSTLSPQQLSSNKAKQQEAGPIKYISRLHTFTKTSFKGIASDPQNVRPLSGGSNAHLSVVPAQTLLGYT